MADQMKPSLGGTNSFEMNEIKQNPVWTSHQTSGTASRPGANGQTKKYLIDLFDLFCFLSGVIIFLALVSAFFYSLTQYFPAPREFFDTPKSCQADTLTEFASLKSLYERDFLFDFYAFLGENATNIDHESQLIWKKSNLKYGDLHSIHSFSTNVSVSEVSSLLVNFYISSLKFNEHRLIDSENKRVAFCSTSKATAVFTCTPI